MVTTTSAAALLANAGTELAEDCRARSAMTSSWYGVVVAGAGWRTDMPGVAYRGTARRRRGMAQLQTAEPSNSKFVPVATGIFA